MSNSHQTKISSCTIINNIECPTVAAQHRWQIAVLRYLHHAIAEWMNFSELISIMLQSFDWLRSKTMWNCEIKFYWISITFGAIADSLIPSHLEGNLNEWMNECKRKKSERAHSKNTITQIKLKACHKKMKPLFLILKPIITGLKSELYDTI